MQIESGSDLSSFEAVRFIQDLDRTMQNCDFQRENYVSLISYVSEEQKADIGLDSTMKKHHGLEADMLDE